MGASTRTPVGKQSARQVARRAALDAQAKMRAQRVGRDKRLSALVVQVMVALGEREEVVACCERRAGEALQDVTEDEGLGMAEAVPLCGEGMTRRGGHQDARSGGRCERLRTGEGGRPRHGGQGALG